MDWNHLVGEKVELLALSPDDRRIHRRFASNLRCWLRSRERTVCVRIRDISRGGVGLRAPTLFQQGENAEVELEGSTVNLRANVRVAWSHPDDDHPTHTGTGLRFIEILEGEELLPEDDEPDDPQH